MTERLTPKMQKVGLAYLKGMSMKDALLAAGYSESYAKHNAMKYLRIRAVQKFIRERQQQEAEASLADAIFVERELVKLATDPSSTPAIKATALKQLDQHHQWMSELVARTKEIEKAPSQAAPPVTININEVK